MAAISVSEYEKSISALQEAMDFAKARTGSEFKIARDACIHRFEFCIELAWKVSAKFLGSASTTSKPVLREMLQNHLIGEIQIWFDFIDARNKSSHTYDEKIAQEVFVKLPQFLVEGKALLQKLKLK